MPLPPQPPHDPTGVDDAGLIAQVGAGDRAAFRELYARYSSPLFSLAMRMLGETGTAEEALQDAFLKIWRHAAAFDPAKARPFTWAVTLTRRTCIDQLRKNARRPATASLSDPDSPLEPCTPETIRRFADHRDDDTRLRDALAALPEMQRHALDLALFAGLSHPQIAEKIQQPVGTVKTWIRRGLLQLRDTLNSAAS